MMIMVPERGDRYPAVYMSVYGRGLTGGRYMAVISVVMPVYNTPVPYLKEAVGSILGQTFRDFELIIVDDGSENETEEYLRTLSDPRIRLIRNETNRGITRSLNIGFAAARGKYIARMDGDDISFPERFEKQFAFMESHPDVFVCGADSVNLGDEPRPVSTVMEDMESYRVRMLFAYPGPTHPTAFFPAKSSTGTGSRMTKAWSMHRITACGGRSAKSDGSAFCRRSCFIIASIRIRSTKNTGSSRSGATK